ncbi:MAG: ParB/RepB/Spo0J family partition protein [Desulfobacteraceae bacterium]
MTKKKRRTGLGRGISALIPDIDSMDETGGDFFMCRVETITPNPYQPRSTFSEEELERLKESIVDQGILQPLLVRKNKDSYELIAGERRLKAAVKAEFTHVPALLKSLTDEQMLEVSIIENIQRENLNPLEEAHAYHRLISEFQYTQAMVAEKIGKSRSAIANFIRLTTLPEPIRQSLATKQISMGHARALLGAGVEADQLNAWKTVVEKALSVRATEQLIQKLKSRPEKKKEPLFPEEKQRIKEICTSLEEKISSRVNIQKNGDKGKLMISFDNDEELNRIVALFDRTS